MATQAPLYITNEMLQAVVGSPRVMRGYIDHLCESTMRKFYWYPKAHEEIDSIREKAVDSVLDKMGLYDANEHGSMISYVLQQLNAEIVKNADEKNAFLEGK